MHVTGDDGVNRHGQDEGDDAGSVAWRAAELRRLAVLAAGGDRVALDQFLRLIRPAVSRYCRARLGTRALGPHAPDDVAQEILLAVCGALPKYRGNEVPVMAFVFGIARFKVADAFRASGRDRSDPTDDLPEVADTGAGPELAAMLVSEADELRRMLDLLPEHYREILVLRVGLGYSAEETARAVGSSAGAVRVAQHRALTKLRTLIARSR